MKRFDRGVFTLSLDFELVWGSRDLLPLPELERAAQITRAEVFYGLLDAITRAGITATWATVGQLFRGQQPDPGRGLVPPRHTWHPEPWLAGVPAGDEASQPAFYARSLVEALVQAGQEVGSHSFTHPIFGDPGCSRETADSELTACVAAAEALGIELRSFVFPRNAVGHLDLLAAHGFTTWRGVEPVWYRRAGVPGALTRAAHLAGVMAARTPPTVFPSEGAHGLCSLPASASFLPVHGVRRWIPLSRRVERCKRGLDAAAADGRVFHLYLHPINVAAAPRPMLLALEEVFGHAARLADRGKLTLWSMDQVTRAFRSRGA